MNERLFCDFLSGDVEAPAIAADLDSTKVTPDSWSHRTSVNYRVLPISREFSVRPEHMIRLVDALLAGALTPDQVATALFCVEAAPDRFVWDTDTTEGDRVSNAVFWLGTPEINYPLTLANLSKIRHYLVTGQNTLTTFDTKA